MAVDVTRQQEQVLMRFIREDEHFCRYYDGIYILFHTGLRISEFCGLTVQDIELKEMRIRVDHQLQRTSDMKYVVQKPKTEKGICFLFLDKNKMPLVALRWEKCLEHIIQKYNKLNRVQMLKVTPHVCRHTFCTNMARAGMNPKTLQYIMEYADISVTMNTYTHVNFDDARQELKRVSGLMKDSW